LVAKRKRVALARAAVNVDALMERAMAVCANKEKHRFRKALSAASKINIIAEFKRASPSKGLINDSIDPVSAATAYHKGGAAAISVLTEEDFFRGSLDDLRAVRNAVNLPILRKDFIYDPFQIYEAVEAGADAILLIAAMLNDGTLAELYNLAEDRLGVDALVEVHTAAELKRVKNLGARLIGVNNRDLSTFDVTLDVSRELIRYAPADAVMISESGLKTRDDLEEMLQLGYSGCLIGERLMRSTDPSAMLDSLN
ncbi:MAG: indole-3-glycerol phosphate synthase TrpC, partial [Pyrinomonadaceae bacterium]